MQRSRQFSTTRMKHSTVRPHITPSRGSQISRYQEPSPAHRLDYSRQTTTKKPLENSNVNQRKIARSRLRTQSVNKLICNNCYNHRLSKGKHEKRERQLQEERSYEQYNNSLIMERQNHLEKSARKVRNDRAKQILLKNTAIIKQHQRKIQKQKNQKNHEAQLIQNMQSQWHKQQMEQQRILNQRRENLKKDLHQQMIKAQNRKNKRQQQQRNYKVNTIINDYSDRQVWKRKAERDRQYRDNLLRQMQEKKQKDILNKSRQQQAEITNLEFVTFKHLEEQEAMKVIQSRKRETLKNHQQRQRQLKQQKYKQERERIQNEERQQQYQRELRKQNMQREQERQQQLNRYIKDLKQQMQKNREKRQKQFTKMHELTQTSIPISANQQRLQRVKVGDCGDCHRQFPQNMLSEFISS